MRTCLIAALSLSVTGCLVFDASKIEPELAGDSEDGGAMELEPSELFVDECTLDGIAVVSESTSLSLDLAQFRSVGLGYPKCTESQFQGPDTFFILDAKAGERWNINAAPQNVAQDVAIVVLGEQCAATGCQGVRDRCGAGFDEDFALIADRDRQYVVSVDTHQADVFGEITLSLDRSLCGNGVLEAGESCDGGPDCDDQCRRLVPDGIAAEQEPNDIFTGVDVVGLPDQGGTVTITGTVGGPCDEDHYAIIVPEGADLSVSMNAPGGAPCPEGTPQIELPLVDFLAPGGPVRVGSGKVDTDAGGCPRIDATNADPDFDFARGLDASEYHLIINAFETEESIPYEIVFDLRVD